MRKAVPITDEYPYHVSVRCPNRESFKANLSEVWSIFEDYLFLTSKAYELAILAFVLMPNHLHILLRTPKLNLGPAMNYLLRETSREMNYTTGRINQNWGGPYHKTLIDTYHYYMNVYKYIYRNPVRARLCDRVEDYPYSTLFGTLGKSNLIIPIEEDTLLFDPNFNIQTLNWLNTPSCPQDEAEVRRALRKSILDFGKNQETGHASRLITELI